MKRIITVLLIFSMILGSMAGYTTSKAKEVPAASGETVTHPVKGTLYAVPEDDSPDELYKRSSRAATLQDLGEIMNVQMENYLSGAGTPAAYVNDLTDAEKSQVGLDLKSKVTFSLSSYQIPYDGELTLQYVYEAIGTYPNLCALHTCIAVSYTRTNKMLTGLTVYSPVTAGQMKAKVRSYKSRFEELIAVPEKDDSMSEMEKLLYLHDEIVIRAAYAQKNLSEAAVHAPVTLLLDGEVVCQAYAGVMNQAAIALGIESRQVISDTHAWNAVQLDGKWYYLDATFDDPVGNLERDYVSHEYFLFNVDDIKANADVMESHTLDNLNQKLYGSITENMGTAYRDIFPKKQKLKVQMSYLDGSWYYGNGRQINCWDGESQAATVFSDIPAADNRACDVCQEKLYVSGSDGLSVYENGQLTPLVSDSVKRMAIIDGVLNYQTETGWKTIVLVERLPEEEDPVDPPSISDPVLLPGSGDTGGSEPDQAGSKVEEVKVVTPGRVTVTSIKNKKKKTMTFKFRKVKNAKGYQYSYGTNKKFKKSKTKTKTTKKLSVTIKKLKKKTTYYVRVRAYSVTNGTKKYGKWSKTRKVKIKK